MQHSALHHQDACNCKDVLDHDRHAAARFAHREPAFQAFGEVVGVFDVVVCRCFSDQGLEQGQREQQRKSATGWRWRQQSIM